MVKLLIINVTEHTPQNRLSDTITHAALLTINGVVVVPRNLMCSSQKLIPNQTNSILLALSFNPRWAAASDTASSSRSHSSLFFYVI